MLRLTKEVITNFEQALAAHNSAGRRIGAELKFPLVNSDGSAVSLSTVCALWDYLGKCGWQAVKDSMTGNIVGAKKPGEVNQTVASCETGFCKIEFSLAHVANLFDLESSIRKLRQELRPFSEKHQVYFLGYGIQPVTPPSRRLLMQKGRTSVWDKVFGSNRIIPEEDGDDVCLFTLNAASHVHVQVSQEEAIPAVNVLNGFAPAQIALTANSNIWKGRIDPQYKCVAEKFWDWWMLDTSRIGLPEKPFRDLKDYVRSIARFRPVYVERLGKPIVLTQYETFEQYYYTGRAIGLDTEGREVSFVPEKADLDLHCSCFWHNARISRYYTVENRVNDQQPPDDLICIAALTLGLISALPRAWKELSSYDWQDLRAVREASCQEALNGEANNIKLVRLAREMVALARLGLQQRGLGEEIFLAGLQTRLQKGRCPADEARDVFNSGGVRHLVKEYAL